MSNRMEFAKYYNATKVVPKLIEEGKISKDYGQYKGIYVCKDTHDMWICRILEGYNSEYENEEDKWLVEINKISKYDLLDFINDKLKVNGRLERDEAIDIYGKNIVIEKVIEYDEEQGYENWDNYEYDSLEECVEVIDGGFGIIEL